MDVAMPHELVREIKVVLDVIVSSIQPVDVVSISTTIPDPYDLSDFVAPGG